MRNYSSRFRLPNGKWAYKQLEELAELAKLHVKRIRKFWIPPAYFSHFRSGGHVAALRLHLPNTWYGKLDLSRFFNTVNRNRLTRCLKDIGYSFHEAEEFAIASTVCVNYALRQFALPYGFVQSPLLASLALDKSELGRCLGRLHRRGVSLSVYVDDIIVSADTEQDVRQTLEEIRTAAATSRFRINEEKSGGPSESLRAFNIIIEPRGMEITVDRFEEFCGRVLYSGDGPVSTGVLGYVRSVNEVQANHLIASFPRSFPDTEV